jgi:hypothetical protein
MNADQIVRSYFDRNFRVVFWPEQGAQKGPTEKGWTTRVFTLDDYKPQTRVGLITGQEVEPGKFLHDIDIDWGPGFNIAAHYIPSTELAFGRSSKPLSHCLYTLPEPLPRTTYEDPVDQQMLIEIRGTTQSGELGIQTMVPPSVWSNKEGKREPLTYLRGPLAPASFVENVESYKHQITLAAIAMLFAKRFGVNGFGHEARLCWAGFLSRTTITEDEATEMGLEISTYCNNTEREDVAKVVKSTYAALKAGKKTKGAPALERLLGQDVGSKVVDRIKLWLGIDTDFIRNTNGAIVKDSYENIRRALRLLGVGLYHDVFSGKRYMKEGEHSPKSFNDAIINRLWFRIDQSFRFRPGADFFQKVLFDLADEIEVHPVREYLDELQWDGIPRINFWLRDFGGATETHESSESITYLEAVSSIVLIAAVRRVKSPGCKYDELLVLESPQGYNKSSALRALCPKDEWFSDDLPLDCDAKEIIERTQGKWIIEASDLVGGRKADRDHLKSMLSRQYDGPVRMAYERTSDERARQCVFIGTHNSFLLEDPTGGRRFWPVRVDRFKVEDIARNRDQLWAEAVERERAGEPIRLPEELWSVAGEMQEERRSVDHWEDIIGSYVEGKGQVASQELFNLLGIPPAQQDRPKQLRVAEIMKERFKYVRKSFYDQEQGKTVAGYIKSDVAPVADKRKNDPGM